MTCMPFAKKEGYREFHSRLTSDGHRRRRTIRQNTPMLLRATSLLYFINYASLKIPRRIFLLLNILIIGRYYRRQCYLRRCEITSATRVIDIARRIVSI